MSERTNRDRSSKRGNSYKRDTILMICALAVLFLSPVGISIYSNYQEQQMMDEYAALIEESLASSSEATPSEAEESEEDVYDETEATEEETGASEEEIETESLG